MDEAIQREFDRAGEAADRYRARLEAERKADLSKWYVESERRAKENGLNSRIGVHTGRIDDKYTAELPLTLGWTADIEGPVLAYVSLGGVDVTEYLPPDVLADIHSHIQYSWEEEKQ